MADKCSANQDIGESSTIPDAKVKDSGTKVKHSSIFCRIWNRLFGMQQDDFEKRLQHISKEEATVRSRITKRSQYCRRLTAYSIIYSVMLEVVAVAYAVIMIRSSDINWKMRAIQVSPAFVFPALCFLVYSTFRSLLRMRDCKDQKTVERLVAERQSKIDELKEKSNYYITQQLIQSYDTDPAAKAAAASVMASKLGADSGLKLLLADESKPDAPKGTSSDVELMESSGLRNRGHHHFNGEGSDAQPLINEGQIVRKPTENDGGWLARMVALLVGDVPEQSYALVCSNCHRHNGLAKEEEFPYVTYYCPHCHTLNRPKPTEEPEKITSEDPVG